MKRFALSALLLSSLCAAAEDAATNAAASLPAIAAASLRSAVLVLAHPKQDEGVPPLVTENLESLLRSESSYEERGFLTAGDTVWCKDFGVVPTLLSSITVRAGDRSAAAEYVGRAEDRDAVKLRLLEPLEGVPAFGAVSTNPPAFRSEPQPMIDGRAVTRATAVDLEGDCRLWDDGRRTLNFWNTALFDEAGAFAGLCYGEVDAAGPFDPEAWPLLDPAALAAATERAASDHRGSLVPVTITFRSPKEGADSESGMTRRWRSSSSSDGRVDDETARTMTELKTVGRVVEGGRVLVDLNGARAAVPRLERIEVFAPDGAAHPAAFAFVHKRVDLLGADLAAADAAAFEPLPVHAGSFREFENHLGVLVRAEAAGAGKASYRAEVLRQGSIRTGWRDRVELYTPTDTDLAGDTYFSLGGEAVWTTVFPISGEGSIGEDRSWGRNARAATIPIADFLAFAKPAPEDIAPIHPADAADEGATGWIGLDLQPLDRDLAEAMGALEATDGGSFGAIVAKVHPGSSAEKEGVAEGWILLTIRSAGERAPRRVQIEEDDDVFSDGFPWEHLDEIPPQYMSRIPAPWPKVANSFTAALWAFGAGAEVEAEFLAEDGAKTMKKLVVERAPAHFASAPIHKWEEGGMTVCDLTFEVREYLNLAADAPGVVVCKTEPGSKAATAGLRRFEVVRSVNGAPVADAEAFGKAVEGTRDFAFEVLRHTDTRVVRFSLPALDGSDDAVFDD